MSDNTLSLRQSIRFRLILSFGLFFALLVAVMVVSWLTLAKVQSRSEWIANTSFPLVDQITEAQLMMVKISLEARHAMLSANDPFEQKVAFERISEHRSKLIELLDSVEAKVVSEQGHKIMRKIRQADVAFWKSGEQTAALIEAGDITAAFAMLKDELVPARNIQIGFIAEQIQWQEQLMNNGLADANSAITKTKINLTVFVAISLAILGFLVWRLVASLAQRLAKLQNVLVSVEQSGNLTLQVGAVGQDEVGRTAAAFDKMIEKIATVVHDSLQSAEAITTAAQSMSVSSERLERSASVQSESASAVASAIEETSVSISDTARNAQTADETASRARSDIMTTLTAARETARNVDDLACLIDEASGDIARLAASSRQIDGIVNTIKTIADQTNLLALNAAIEAARAGEQGRGFAVVADEVRKLAESTTVSTSEISALINGIQGEVDTAVSRMQVANTKAGTTRDRVIASTIALDAAKADTDRVTESVRTIAHAVREQDVAVQQVSRRVEQIAQMTEQTTAEAQASAATARQLDSLAGKLRQAVGRFKI